MKNKKYSIILFTLTVVSCSVLLMGRSVEAEDDKDVQSIIIKVYGSETLHVVPVYEIEESEVLIAAMEREPSIEFVVPNYQYMLAIEPDDTYYSSLWYLDQINAPEAWDTTTGSSDVVIAVLDSGIDVDHPDLASNIWVNSGDVAGNSVDDDGNGYVDDTYGWDFIEDSNDVAPKFDDGWTQAGINHGTAVAGVAGAVGDNAIGVTGLAWDVGIMSVRVLDGAGVGDTRAVYNGIRYAVDNGADFINLSFVGDSEDTLLTSAISEAAAAGVVVFAAAGNNNVNLNDSPRYPVCSENVIGVGGTDQNDNRLLLSSGGSVTGGSNYGTDCIDISAPATNFMSTVFYDPANSFDEYYLAGWSGTSLASPLVTAAAALLKANNSSLTGDQIVETLLDAADTITFTNADMTGSLGSGRLNIGAALDEFVISQFDIVVGAGNGGGPHVRVFDSNGNRSSQFFAFAESFRGGVNVAAGDLDGDGTDEIIAGAGNGGGPHIRIFNGSGELQSQFFAYAESFRGGVNVAAGDLDGDGIDEIVAGAGVTGGPHVRVFDQNGVRLSQFFAYAESFRGGVNVAAGDLDGDGTDEIVAGAGVTGGPHVRVFDQNGVRLSQFFAYAESFRGGVNVAVVKK